LSRDRTFWVYIIKELENHPAVDLPSGLIAAMRDHIINAMLHSDSQTELGIVNETFTSIFWALFSNASHEVRQTVRGDADSNPDLKLAFALGQVNFAQLVSQTHMLKGCTTIPDVCAARFG